MDALTYLKEKARMTKGCQHPSCYDCCFANNISDNSCDTVEDKNPEKAIEVVEKWSKENPVKTYKSVFFEKFPNAQKTGDNYPIPNVKAIFGGTSKERQSWHEQWDEEYQEPRP